MTVNESYNEEMEEVNVADSDAGDAASPVIDDVTTGSSSPSEKNAKAGGADETNDETISNDRDSFNEHDKDSSAVEETANVDEEEKNLTSLVLELDDTTPTTSTESSKVQDTTTTPEPQKVDEIPITPTPPKINEDLIKELSAALDSCEQMRRVNLEVEYSSASPSLPPSMAVNHEKCTYCQRETWQQFMLNPTPPDNGENNTKSGGGGINIVSLKLDGSRIKNLDGSRIRRFRSNVGSFFAKPNDDDDNQDAVRKEDGGLFAKATDSMDAVPKDVSITTGGSNESDSIEGESGNMSNSSSGNTNSSSTQRAPRKTFLLQKPPPPCLTCGHPVCKKHQSSTFSTSSIRICEPCAQLFELDFLVDVITTTASNTAECRKKVNQMVDCYDRAKLLLFFTSQYTDQIAEALEHSTVRSNKIGVGSSATGMVSGMAGVVGCGALLFPPVAAVGIPLLISSLVFGGAATAAQTGDAAVQYFSEPNKLADKMVTLHGMMLSLLRISEVLSYGLLKDHDDLDGDSDDRRKALADEIHALLEKHGVATKGVKGLRTAVVGGTVAAAGAEISATSIATTSATVAGRSSRFFGRVGTTAASSARFIPIAGGILSAACVVVEGKELKKTVSKINEGNPCEKAEQIRSIRDEMDKFPDSSVIADECRRVFEIAEKECAFF